MVKKVIMNFDLSKASGPDCIPVVVLKNCEPELSYIQAELFNMCLKESCFPDCWKVSSVVSLFKNVRERSTAKTYCHVSLLYVVRRHCGLWQEVVCWYQSWKNLVSFDWSKNTGAIDVKMDGSVLEEKSPYKMLGLTLSFKLDWGSIAKTASKQY